MSDESAAAAAAVAGNNIYTSPSIFSSFPFITQQQAANCEQSTLIYTLAKDCEKINWNEFSLIIRSLHSYKVLEHKEDEKNGTVSVTVGYFANCSNARKRLAGLSEFISVSRLSTNINPNELQTLQELRAKFGFGNPIDEEESIPPTKGRKPGKRPRYANAN